ncbi:GDP-mannose 4,6-dehydratase [Candidatus Pelagibacter sp. HIMB1509]|uniref:GDP-mannose 4,6-dehydratase n=1 Tax=Candidatus Pelagibacter sp. HIMB1509 TaxID=3413339 RepID=UPI003F83287D
MKKALIFGITGQDGAYLAKYLIKKKYVVHGVIRRSSSFNTSRLDDIYEEPFKKNKKLILHYGDVIDSSSVFKLIEAIMPDEIYNLAAQSHVAVSFEIPEYTSNVDGIGTLRILEVIKSFLKRKKIKFYQAGTSEMFGGVQNIQDENTKFDPKSPYAASKVFAHSITKIYRDAYGIFAANGILFNHESPLRGETFVTKKIVKALTKIKLGKQKCLYLGNLYSKRDWGHAKDYVAAMWKILQAKKADDFVIATNRQFSIKQFINLVAKELKLKLNWRGKGINEIGFTSEGKVVIKISKKYFRPLDVNNLQGNYSKAKKILKWKPETSLAQLIKEMVNFELKNND